MASPSSMNNWLGFSLSSNHHDYPQTSILSHHDFDDEHQISSFDHLTPNSTMIPNSIFEAFNTNPQSQSQDWSMKDGSCNSTRVDENEESPKLENFLQTTFDAADHHSNINGMGLSMIKNWLQRSNPPPPDKAGDNEPPAAAAVGGQTLSLSMSTSSQSSDNKVSGGGGAIESVPRKAIETFGQRTSIYRGVTRHRWTGRYEAHLWDNSCRREGQTRKGRQVYLGGYDKEEKAARAYDLAALKYWGTTTTTNLPISNYETELEEMKHMTRQEYVASLRRKSSGFSRGASIYRGVTRHHQHGRWQARIGRVAGNKDLYLGTFSTQEEAAEAYDVAAIKFRGLNAVTNFETSRYDVRSIMESRSLPIGAAKRLKDKADVAALHVPRVDETDPYGWAHLGGGGGGGGQPLPLTMYPSYQRMWCKQEQDSSSSSNISHDHIHHQLQLGQNQGFMHPSMLQLSNLSGLDPQPVPSPSLVAYDTNYNNAASACDGFGYEGVFGLGDNANYNRNLYYQQLPSNDPPTFTMWNGT